MIVKDTGPEPKGKFADENFELSFGKHKGKRIGDLMKEDPKYILWLDVEGVVKIAPTIVECCEEVVAEDFDPLDGLHWTDIFG